MIIATSEPPCGAGSSVKAVTVIRRTRGSVDVRHPGRGRVGSHPGGAPTLLSGCPAGSAFQNMILSK
jgi:hypothetical protein